MHTYHQASRIIKILEWLSTGQKLTTADIVKRFQGNVKRRDVQRDFLKILDCDIPLEWDEKGRERIYYFPAHYRKMVMPTITQNEMLSLYMLKAYLKTFSGTEIEKETKKLIKNLEHMAPGEIFRNEGIELLWDQNIGQFDYSSYSNVIQQVIDSIIANKPVKVTYKTIGSKRKHSYDAILHRLFVYDSLLYVASYIPKHKNYITLSVQGIENISYSEFVIDPTWKFDVEKFTKKRFGVFAGEPQTVVLEIGKEYAIYFENRLWHSSQELKKSRVGDLTLTMQVPIVPDLVNWIMGWGSGVEVKEPKELINEVKKGLANALSNYK